MCSSLYQLYVSIAIKERIWKPLEKKQIKGRKYWVQ